MKQVTVSKYKKEVWTHRTVSIDWVVAQLGDSRNNAPTSRLRWKLGTEIDLAGCHLAEAERQPVVTVGMAGSGYTGLVALSVKTATPEELKRQAARLPQTLLACTGMSGRTLKIVVGCTLTDGTLPTERRDVELFHQNAWYMAVKFYEAQLGVTIEKQHPRADRGFRLGYDPSVYYNPQSLTLLLGRPTVNMLTPDRQTLSASAVSLAMLPDYNDLQMQMTRFQYCYRDVLEQHFDEADLMLSQLAENCIRNGLDKEFCIKRLLHTGLFKRQEVLVRSVFDNAYIVTRSDGRLQGWNTQCAIPGFTIETERLKRFLQDRFLFRRNVVSKTVEYVERGSYQTAWQQLTPEAANRITIDALSSGIEAWDKDLKRYVDSTYVADYHPVTDYLNQLPHWDSHDRIRPLALCVPTQNRQWPDDFRRWLLSMVAQWMGRNQEYGNAMVPLLIGRQGDGKSTFCRLLLPPELRDYYTDRIDFANQNQAERALSRYCLVNVDEFDQVTRRQTVFLKHLLQKCEVKQRRLYHDTTEQLPRLASFVATTNDPTPLSDPTGSRRYLCIETTGRIDVSTPIDYSQLYAQALTEVLHGERTWFNEADEQRIQQSNAPYQLYDSLEEAFRELFRRPAKGDKTVRLSATQIVQKIHARYPSIATNRSRVQEMGRLLHRLGIPLERSNSQRSYTLAVNPEP